MENSLILLLKISTFLALALLVFTRRAINLKIYAGIIFIFNLTFIYKNISLHKHTVGLAILGTIFIILIARFYKKLIKKHPYPFPRWNAFFTTLLCLCTSFIFLKANLQDPLRFAMLFTGIFLVATSINYLDILLGTLVFSSGIFFLNPVLTGISIIFLSMLGIIVFFVFGSHEQFYS